MRVIILLSLLFSLQAQAFPQDFKIFKDQQSALRFVYNASKTDSNPLKLVSINYRGYEKANRAIEEIMIGYKALFPNLTYGLPDPHPIIVSDDSLNAFVLTHEATREGNPFIIMIFSGMFKDEIPEDEFYGIVAHEMAHLLFEHSKKEVIEKLEIFYEIKDGEEEPLGFKEPNDARIEYIVGNLINALKYKNHSLVDKIKDQYHLNLFRLFTTEEHADDASIRILDYLGRDATSVGKFMLRWLKPAEKERCLSMIGRRQRVPYGKLYRKHRGDCWRYDHALRMAEAL